MRESIINFLQVIGAIALLICIILIGIVFIVALPFILAGSVVVIMFYLTFIHKEPLPRPPY